MTSRKRVADPVETWAVNVDRDKIVAGPYVRAAATRHLSDLENMGKGEFFYDRAAADRVIGFFERRLKLTGGDHQGKPFVLHDSQKFRIGSLFGWKRKDDNCRRFTRFYDEEGKGNGKSPMLAGIGLYGLIGDGEQAAEIYAAASKKDQAYVLFNDAVAMIEQSPALWRRCRLMGENPVWEIIYRGRNGDKRVFKPISSEKGGSGPRPSMALCDEIHEHRNRDVIDILENGFKFRRNPLLVMATNAGTDRTSICFEEHQHAIRVVTGEISDDSTFAFVCSLDEDDDWENDPDCWIKANPLLGEIITREYLAKQVNRARDIPGKRNGIARLNFCEWTDAETAAFSRAVWMQTQVHEPDLEDLIKDELPCFGGLDLSRTRDLTAFSATFVTDDAKDEEQFHSFTYFWTPGDTMRAREEIDNAPYTEWSEKGFLEAVPGQRINYSWLADALARLNVMLQCEEIAGDHHGMEYLADHLADINVSLPIVSHPQGFTRRVLETDKRKTPEQKDVFLSMPDSISKLENAVFEGRLKMQANPVMNWCAANVVYAENRTGARMFAKDKAYGRIDGMVSLAMSIGIATCRERSDGMTGSYLDDHELMVI